MRAAWRGGPMPFDWYDPATWEPARGKSFTVAGCDFGVVWGEGFRETPGG